jgi:O-succinylbenzoate synthase
LTSIDAVLAAVRSGAADVVSVKPARLGGAQAAAMAVAIAAEHGAGAFVGGMLELGIGRATSAAVAALPGCTLPTDLGPSERYVQVDVTDPVVVDDAGCLVVPDGPGCGRTPLAEVLERFVVDEVLLVA